MAVACAALLLAGSLYAFADQRRREADAALVVARRAEVQARAAAALEQAIAEARDADRRLAQLSRSVAVLERRIAAVTTALESAQTAAARRTAETELERAVHDKLEIEQRMRAMQPTCGLPERHWGAIHIPKECLDNPLAKGCM
jgi:hypothetical protein